MRSFASKQCRKQVLEWFEDDLKKEKKGSVKTDSFAGATMAGSEVTLDTATKKHIFQFSSEAEAQKWLTLWKGFS